MQEEKRDVMKKIYPKSIDQLIDRLRLKKLKIGNVDFAKKIIYKVGYSGIKQYRLPLYDINKREYIKNATINDIKIIYEFDLDLKMLFLKYFLVIENLFRDAFNYIVYEKIKTKSPMSRDLFNCKGQSKDIGNFNIFRKECEKNARNRIKWNARYLKEGYEIPSWILFDSFNMGYISKYYEFLEWDYKKSISEYISENRKINIKAKWILSFLKSLKYARNLCVHNEPLFSNIDYEIQPESVKSFDKLYSKKEMKSNDVFNKGLFSYIIILKYFLDKENFKSFFKSFKKILNKLRKRISKKTYNEVFKIIKMPHKYKRIVNMEVNENE